MKAAKLALVTLTALFTAAPAMAIDRNARMIDWVTAQVGLFDDADRIQVTVWSENIADVEMRNVSWLAGAGYTYSNPEDETFSTEDGFLLALGLKYYPVEQLSLGVIGQYEGYGHGPKLGITSARLDAKYRFISASEKISPYCRAVAGINSVKNRDIDEVSGRSSVTLVQAGFGVDIMMTDTLAFVLEALYSNSESDHQTYELDGCIIGFSMKYYFD